MYKTTRAKKAGSSGGGNGSNGRTPNLWAQSSELKPQNYHIHKKRMTAVLMGKWLNTFTTEKHFLSKQHV
jgi:hypothetical protein